jgi:outer membrane lipoprotein SlyB
MKHNIFGKGDDKMKTLVCARTVLSTNGTSEINQRFKIRSFFIVTVLIGTFLAAGCESQGGTGALVGGGIGALAGQAIGGDTGSTLIGAAVGSGVGYVIGNKKDKARAKEMNAAQYTKPVHNDVGVLGGTRWNLVNLYPKDIAPPYVSKIIEFKPNGRVITTTTKLDGSVEVFDESYRVVGDTLVINKPGYMINTRFGRSGTQLTINAETFSAVLKQLP